LTDMVNEPFVFLVSDPARAWISFKLLRTDPRQTEQRKLIWGGGVLQLS
jgi:hypothetical protein